MCAVLTRQFSPLVGAMVVATFVVYVSWSVVLTQIAAAARKRVNELDNASTSKVRFLDVPQRPNRSLPGG